MKRVSILLIIIFSFILKIKAQDKTIQIIQANKYSIVNVDSGTLLYIFTGNVILKESSTIFKTDSAILNVHQNILEAFNYINIEDGDSILIKALYLKYYGNEKKAILRKKVILTDKISKLTTDSFDYYLKTKIGLYKNGGTLVKKDLFIKSENAVYNGISKNTHFKKNVYIKNKDEQIYTDSINFNSLKQFVNINCLTRIVNPTRTILTDSATYNFDNKQGEFFTRSLINDTSYSLESDRMIINDSTNEYFNYGNVIYIQKDSNHFELYGNYVASNTKNKYLFATGHPWIKFSQNLDTFYLSADTIISNKLENFSKNRTVENRRNDTAILFMLDTNKQQYLEAFHHVQLFSDSIQVVCDSLFYSQHDSVCRLIGNPIIWLQNNQITGDTMLVFVNNNELEQLNVFENGFIINKIDSTEYFNQIKGTFLKFIFLNNEIERININGSAENLYYLQDEEKKMMGVNRSSAQKMSVIFNKRQPSKIKYIENLKGTTYPMNKFPILNSKLRGFTMYDSLRPKKWQDIIR